MPTSSVLPATAKIRPHWRPVERLFSTFRCPNTLQFVAASTFIAARTGEKSGIERAIRSPAQLAEWQAERRKPAQQTTKIIAYTLHRIVHAPSRRCRGRIRRPRTPRCRWRTLRAGTTTGRPGIENHDAGRGRTMEAQWQNNRPLTVSL